jgi:tRNA threonylcarbamoyl adenosine modification protein (Sua5/YciO/YrdC/YwlC family)
MSDLSTPPTLPACGGDVARAAELLARGELVAFPTETVYGLGADAANDAAVARIFAVNGRPRAYPLIVHLAPEERLEDWALDVPPLAHQLAAAMWPGPLTLILRKGRRVSAAVTGGGDTVGLRVPDHPVAQALLRAFGGAIAAPSANRFGAVSPTRAEHVVADLGADVAYVLDGGACDVGIESTIVDLSRGAPALLRPGGMPREEIEAITGPLARAGEHAPAAPGTHRDDAGADQRSAAGSPAPSRRSTTCAVGDSEISSRHCSGSGQGRFDRFNHTARIPAARAPRTSAAHESPSITAESAGVSQRASAIRKIAGSGLATPASSEITSTSTRSVISRCASFSTCSATRLLVTTQTRARERSARSSSTAPGTVRRARW